MEEDGQGNDKEIERSDDLFLLFTPSSTDKKGKYWQQPVLRRVDGAVDCLLLPPTWLPLKVDAGGSRGYW